MTLETVGKPQGNCTPNPLLTYVNGRRKPVGARVPAKQQRDLMKDNRTSFTGFNPFAPAERWSPSCGSENALAVNGKRRDELAAGLRAVYAELLDAPLPERFVRLIEQLDASAREDAR